MTVAVATDLTAGTWVIDPVHSSINFSVRHLMVSKVRGEFSGISGTVQLDPEDPANSKIEARIETQRHDRCRRVRRPLSREHGHLAFGIHPHRMISSRQRKYAVQVVALHPVLQFPRLVAGIVALFEHRDHYDFHGNRLRRRHRFKGTEQKQSQPHR